MIFRPFLKGKYITLESWSLHWDPEGLKLDPDGLVSDLSEDNFGCDDEEASGGITGTPISDEAVEKSEPKMVRSAQH